MIKSILITMLSRLPEVIEAFRTGGFSVFTDRRSSMEEQLPFKQKCAGSSPVVGTKNCAHCGCDLWYHQSRQTWAGACSHCLCRRWVENNDTA